MIHCIGGDSSVGRLSFLVSGVFLFAAGRPASHALAGTCVFLVAAAGLVAPKLNFPLLKLLEKKRRGAFYFVLFWLFACVRGMYALCDLRSAWGDGESRAEYRYK